MANIWSYENGDDGGSEGATRTHWRNQNIRGVFLVEVALELRVGGQTGAR